MSDVRDSDGRARDGHRIRPAKVLPGAEYCECGRPIYFAWHEVGKWRHKSERREREEQEAVAYAAEIRRGGHHDWRAFNLDIIERFSLTALIRIKTRAWKLAASPDKGEPR